MTTQSVGIRTDRTAWLAEQAERIASLCRQPISVEADIFGEVETVHGRDEAIRRAVAQLAKASMITDVDWDARMVETAAAVREADHPKHSIIL